ncbi:MAG: hypothetical protein C4334_09355 [Pyrinomonas sp.]|uniref:anti-sigma factor family protein n=1 Tax=Pyrinomonas sp. TaxID=2080306 RepID=UPI00332A9356
MNCQDVKELIPLYLSGELDRDRRAALEGHFPACERCARLLEADRWADEVVRRSCGAVPVDSQLVIARVKRHMKRSGSRWLPSPDLGFKRLAFAACGLSLMVALALFFVVRLTRETSLLEAAAEHHRHEVIEREPRDWYEGETGARSFLAAKLARDEVVDLVEGTGFKLVRARECNLLGDRYAHLVFADGKRDLSVLINLRTDREAPEEVRVRIASLSGVRVAEVRVAARTMILVGGVSHDEAVRLATAAATRFG